MSVIVEDKGRYELFEITHGHRIFVLNGERWFAWVEGQKGDDFQELIVPTRLPTEHDDQKKVVSTDDTIGKDELKDHLEH